jgi:hypothetical protein
VLEEHFSIIWAAVRENDAAAAKRDARDLLHHGCGVSSERCRQHDNDPSILQIEEEQAPETVLLKDLGGFFPEVRLRIRRMVTETEATVRAELRGFALMGAPGGRKEIESGRAVWATDEMRLEATGADRDSAPFAGRR